VPTKTKRRQQLRALLAARVLVIGAGEMAEETLRYLKDEGVQRIIVVNPQAEPARMRALAHSLDGAIYGGSSLDFTAWKRDFSEQMRPHPLRRRRSHTRRTKAMLPELNPRSA